MEYWKGFIPIKQTLSLTTKEFLNSDELVGSNANIKIIWSHLIHWKISEGILMKLRIDFFFFFANVLSYTNMEGKRNFALGCICQL